MNPRTFNFICIAVIIAVGAAAMFMVQASEEDRASESPIQAEIQEASSNAVVLQPLNLGLALAVVADLGLMTLGLVILFKDDIPGRDRYL